MAQITDYHGLQPGETAWEGFGDGEVIIQAKCGSCESGLLYAPARFCPQCSGTGYITRSERRPPTYARLHTEPRKDGVALCVDAGEVIIDGRALRAGDTYDIRDFTVTMS